MLVLRVDPGSYTFIYQPTKRPTVLALSATTCEQVAVSPEIAMGCRRIRFLQAKEGYYCTFSLNKVYLHNTEIQHTLKQLHSLYKQTVTFLTLNRGFTAKLVLNRLFYFIIHLLIKCIKNNRNKITRTTTTQDIRGSPPVQGLRPQNCVYIQHFTKQQF